MNKKQWYACGIILSFSVVLCSVSIVRFGLMLPVDDPDITYAAYSAAHLLLGKVCLIGALISFVCGWLEKEDVR